MKKGQKLGSLFRVPNAKQKILPAPLRSRPRTFLADHARRFPSDLGSESAILLGESDHDRYKKRRE